MNEFNALPMILEIFSKKEPVPLTLLMVKGVQIALEAGDVFCETFDDVFTCLKILRDMNLLLIEEVKEQTSDNLLTYYKIGNLYNGK